jgi:DNA invertase Pin-like site-specific DNA recombinase
MAKIGYFRVSKDEQNTGLQKQALEQAGCVRLFCDEGVSGSQKERAGLSSLLVELQAGDTLAVWKLDRLGRSTVHLLQLLDELREKGVAFQSLTEGIDTNTAAGRMVFSVIAAMAELERENLRERTKAGLQAAKRRGVKLGRPPAMTPDQVSHAKALYAGGEGMRKAAIARSMGVDYSTMRRVLAVEDE